MNDTCLNCLWKSRDPEEKIGPAHCPVCADLALHAIKVENTRLAYQAARDAALGKIEADFMAGVERETRKGAPLLFRC